MVKKVKLLCLVLVMLMVAGCSIEQTSVTSNLYHNLTAHYNGYYYAHEKTLEVEKAILKSLDDDHNVILRLFPKLDTTLAKSYTKDTEEIIKMASISIQRHPNSKWVDDNYIQVGLARLYACDYQNAIQTFKFVNTKSNHAPTRHRALIYLMRTFIEQNDFDRAEEVFLFLEKEKLTRQNQKNLYLEKAYFYQVRNDLDNMVRNLSKVDSLLVKKDRKGRIYFIVGQVYQQLGFNAEAYNYYRKCLGTNPEYEVDFYARLNMVQVAQLTNQKDIKLVRKQFDKMLADTKNEEFRDKIYYELGEFERKQGNLPQAIEDYKLSAHAGSNKRIQGSAYLRLGQIHFDSLKKYSIAKLYYDSSITALPKDFENYNAIKKRQEILGEFARYTETITLNDSLLYYATLDTATVRKKIDSVLLVQTKKISATKKKKKSSTSTSSSGNQNESNAFFNSNQTTSGVDWYFGNTSAVALGQTEFQRVWGTLVLEDDWRRSNKTAVVIESLAKGNETVSANAAQTAATENIKVDKAAQFIAQLPQTADDKKKLEQQIEEAYFKLGDLFYFNLNEKENAADSYERLLSRFPTSDFAAEALYKLYLIHKDKDEARANYFVERLKKEHPTSTFTRVIINPDYLKETSVAAEKQKLIYKDAFSLFQANNLRASQEKIIEALALGATGFTPQLELLQILITGRTEDVTRYQFELGEFIKKYPDEPLKAYAEKLLQASTALMAKLEKAKGIQFDKTMQGQHRFIVAYNTSDKITNAVASALEKFNDSQWPNLKLITSNLILNDNTILTIVNDFPDRETALSYFDKFLAQISTTKPFSNYKFHNFVISNDNFQTFYRTKALDEYLTFFDRNYQKKNQ